MKLKYLARTNKIFYESGGHTYSVGKLMFIFEEENGDMFSVLNPNSTDSDSRWGVFTPESLDYYFTDIQDADKPIFKLL